MSINIFRYTYFMEITFKSVLWEWQGQGTWCFVTLPIEYTGVIKAIGASPKRGFGSVRVECAIGKTIWKTSIFPDSKSKCYLLPIKKDVRKNESIEVGDSLSVKVRIIEV